MMRKFMVAAAIAAALSLSACASIGTALKAVSDTVSVAAGFQVTQDNVDAAKASYVAVAGFVEIYVDNYRTNPCRQGQRATFTNVCSEYGVARQFQAADSTVYAAINSAQAGVTACRADPASAGCKGLPAAYRTALDAIDTVKGIARNFGWKG